MDCEEVKHINNGRNQARDVICPQDVKTQADVFWSGRTKRWPGEDVHVWNGKWREK